MRTLHDLYELLRSHRVGRGNRTESDDDWIVEAVAVMGSFALGNRDSVSFLETWHGRSDMGVHIAKQLADVPLEAMHRALTELMVRAHNREPPLEQREEFIGLCQAMADDLLGFRKFLEVPGADSPA